MSLRWGTRLGLLVALSSSPAWAAAPDRAPEVLLGHGLPSGWRPTPVPSSGRMIGAARSEAKVGPVVMIVSRLPGPTASTVSIEDAPPLERAIQRLDASFELLAPRAERGGLVFTTRRVPPDRLQRASYVFPRSEDALVVTLVGPSERLPVELDRLMRDFIPSLLRSTEADEDAKEVQAQDLPRD